MSTVLTEFISLLVGGITELASGIGSGVQQLKQEFIEYIIKIRKDDY